MLRANNRFYRVIADPTLIETGNRRTRLVVEPDVPMPAPMFLGDTAWRNATMTVRLSDGPVANFVTPDFIGPWTLRVEEVRA